MANTDAEKGKVLLKEHRMKQSYTLFRSAYKRGSLAGISGLVEYYLQKKYTPSEDDDDDEEKRNPYVDNAFRLLSKLSNYIPEFAYKLGELYHFYPRYPQYTCRISYSLWSKKSFSYDWKPQYASDTEIEQDLDSDLDYYTDYYEDDSLMSSEKKSSTEGYYEEREANEYYKFHINECISLDLWIEAADRGHTQAAFKIGCKYFRGDYLKKDRKKAVLYFRKALKGGEKEALPYLGYCYLNGKGVKKDVTKGIQYYLKALQQNTFGPKQEVLIYLADCYFEGKGLEKNIKKAIELWNKAADLGNIEEKLHIAELYYKGEIIDRDYEKAFKLFFDLQDALDFYVRYTARYYLGKCYYRGEGVEKNYKEAFDWWEQNADSFDFPSQLHVTTCDSDRPVYTSTLASLCNLGLCYYRGHGVEATLSKCLEYIEKAAKYHYKPAEKLIKEFNQVKLPNITL